MLMLGGDGEEEQRDCAIDSISGDRSRAFMVLILGRERSLRVLRPVPAPSSVIVWGELVVGRRVKAWVRRAGRRWSSIDSGDLLVI